MEHTPPKRRSRKKLVIVTLILAGILIAALATLFLIWRSNQKAPYEGYNQYTSQAQQFEKETLPSEPLQKAIYYGQIGTAYKEDGQYDKALKYFLDAQKIIDANNLGSVYVFHQSLADVYGAKGDKGKEKLYLQKQLDYLKQLQKTNPNDGGATANAITFIEDRLAKL